MRNRLPSDTLSAIAIRNNISITEVAYIVDEAKRLLQPKSMQIGVYDGGFFYQHAVTRVGVGPLQTNWGLFYQFEFSIDDQWGRYSVLVNTPISANIVPEFNINQPILLRIDSGCQSGQVFEDRTCDCKEQMIYAMRVIQDSGQGVIIHIPYQDGRGMGLPFKLVTLMLQKRLNVDTVEAAQILANESTIDIRTYRGIILILRFFGIPTGARIKLLTNNPAKTDIFRENNYQSLELMPVVIPATTYTFRHLCAKQKHLGHLNLVPQS